jgi:cyclopropane fatty-acyl-phospholipid synthase-like methyltransferase
MAPVVDNLAADSRHVAAVPAYLDPAVTAPTVLACYDVLELCRACGITDFTDGKYVDNRTDRAAYLAAQARQADDLLDQIACTAGSRLLDIGCGYGRIVAAANDRGAQATGITISPPQVAAAQARGLDVRLCNYRNLFRGGGFDHWEGAFTGLVANGSLEHFVQAEEAAEGLADERYAEFFDICHRLLGPGGKLITTAIHWRTAWQVHPRSMVGDPDRWPKGSLNYHMCSLHRSFGGWYPAPGQLERCAAGSFHLAEAEDGTRDYEQTSEYWVRQMRWALLTNPRTWSTALCVLARQPRAALNLMRCMLIDESWNYQFQRPAPTQLWRHTWVAV